MEPSEYDKKNQQLQVLLNNLNDVYERATRNSIFSSWHKDVLQETEKVVTELNEIARREGKPTIDVDLSKYIFTPSELSIDDLVTSYDKYQEAKEEYDSKLLPHYNELMEQYNNDEIPEAEYKKAAELILTYYQKLHKERLSLMDNIRVATVSDYQEQPKDVVDKFLEDLSIYNKKLKEYDKKYKEWKKLINDGADQDLIDAKYNELKPLYEELSSKRPDLVKRRGLIYNSKTLKELNTKKIMLESIIKDSTESNDPSFEAQRGEYEGKLTETEELIKNIEAFKKAIVVKKIKPLEDVPKPGGGGGRKPKPKPGDDTDDDYDFNTVDKPTFLGPKTEPPVPPVPPTPPVVQNKYYSLEEILAKILYGYPPDDTIHYKKVDNFIYMNKDIKLINFPKSHGVSILDKPMKLAKSLVSTVVRGIGKLCANIANLNKKRRNTIDGLLQRIEQLTPEEIEFLATNFTVNRMTELSKVIPEVAMSALNKKIALHFNSKLEVVNEKIYECYNEIIRKFNRYTEILELLKDDTLPTEEVENLQNEMKDLDKGLCKNIVNLEEQKSYAAQLNKGGAMSFIENWRARHNSSQGGRNISDKVSENAIKPYNYTKIAENIRNGNGYLAAKDFLYGEKVKIAGTKTSHKLKNWFHKTRVGAYEFKPFVDVADYSQDTYWQDVLSTIAIAASIQNMMYVNQLKSDLALAQQKISTLDQTIATQQQEIAVLNRQIQGYNLYINQVNQQIQANNVAIQDLKNICALYTSDPAQFVDKMTEFAMMETGKVHGLTEYAMQHADAGRIGTTALKSSGQFYSTYDAQGHLFSKDICDKITAISNDATLTAQQKASQIANVMSGVNQNLATTIAAGKADILKGLAMPSSSQWSFDAFAYAVNNIATYDATFVPNVFESFINVAIKTNSIQAINSVLPVSVTGITQLQQLAITLPTVQLLPAIVGLSTLVGKDAVLAIAESYRTPSKKATQNNWQAKTEELAEKVKGVDIDIEKEARRIFDEHEAEWKKKGPIYRLSHRKEKPTMEQAYVEAIKEAEAGRGL